ncbi:activating signal cointegrator 1 complex subunit 2 [Anoplolepis gracilipes]|uniref:activating signal cointegrator 1 complex subunit 2 n=1 Tax=Anoplolepis gracilipes TaxID=354296 RepID=UPI003BA1C6F9
MTNNASRKIMKCYENPDCVPLEELQLNIKNDGVIVVISALNIKWTEKRYFLRYKVPEIYNDDGSEIVGAREHWIEVTSYIIEDLNWLLDLPFYRFWSNIVYNTSIMNTLVSFLQEAPPFYALENFPNKPGMLKTLEKLRYNVLMIFARLATNKESSTEYMSRPFLGNLLYDSYIFTIPIIFDLCQLYGRENFKVVEKIIYSIFTLQPMYNDDLKKSVTCLIKAFENVERRFEGHLDHATEAVALSEKGNDSIEMTLYNLEDLILYILDVSSTLTVLLKSYVPVISTFHQDDFINKLIVFYGNTIPEMYKKLDKLACNDENMPKYIELKHRLDVTRVEILNLYRIIVYEPILNIQEKINTIMESEVRNCVDEYVNLLMNAMSEKEFIIDYHNFYPINMDLEIVSTLCPEIDTIKCDYILQSLYASIGDTNILVNASHTTNGIVAESINVQNSQREEHCNNVSCINNEIESTSKDPDKLMSLISEVKEILCNCGEGFIQQCLKRYNYDVASVVNAVLENNLPPDLKTLDRTLPYIPPDPMEASAAVDAAIGIQRLNIFDNDEFDVMTQDIIDTSRIYMGKKKDKYKDANEMLNDKSEIKKSREIYEKYANVDDNYDDEYDDTYDSHNIGGNIPDDSTEIDAKSFTIPRVLRARDKNNASSEDETEVENEKPVQNDHFVQNPAELRAKVEQQRQSTKEGKNVRDVVGKSKGQGQNKDVLTNRHKKNMHKGTQGNHNRRMGSQIKRRQGMIPS